MAGAQYDPQKPLLVEFRARSPHTFAYKLWFANAGDAEWTALPDGEGDDTTPPMALDDKFATGTHLAYTLLIGGNANTSWRVQVTLSQRGAVLACSPPDEAGITSGEGVERRDRAVTLT